VVLETVSNSSSPTVSTETSFLNGVHNLANVADCILQDLRGIILGDGFLGDGIFAATHQAWPDVYIRRDPQHPAMEGAPVCVFTLASNYTITTIRTNGSVTLTNSAIHCSAA
jgi:hypothetical protein